MGILNEDVCRTCLINKKKEMKSIYEYVSDLAECSSIHINADDQLPKKICKLCIKKIKNAIAFRKQCQISESTLIFALKKKDDLISSDSTHSLENSNKKFPHVKCEVFENESEICNLVKQEPSDDLITIKNEEIELETFFEEPIDDTSNKKELKNVNRKVNYKKRVKKKKFVKEISKDTTTNEYTDQHIINEDKITKYACNICHKEYDTKRKLGSHKNIHIRRGAHLCQTCGKQFTYPENLLRHERIHKNEYKFRCPHCPNRMFVQSSQLKSHLMTHDTSRVCHLCNICGNAYRRAHSLQLHIRQKHSKIIETHPCLICGKIFKDRKNLTCHMSIHGSNNFPCSVCGKGFNRKSNLRTHELIHTNYRPYKCSLCNRAFRQKHVLNYHLRTHDKESGKV